MCLRKGRPASGSSLGGDSPRVGCSTPSRKCTTRTRPPPRFSCQNLRHHLRQGCLLPPILGHLWSYKSMVFYPKLTLPKTGLNHASAWLLSAFGCCKTGGGGQAKSHQTKQLDHRLPLLLTVGYNIQPTHPLFQPHVCTSTDSWVFRNQTLMQL